MIVRHEAAYTVYFETDKFKVAKGRITGKNWRNVEHVSSGGTLPASQCFASLMPTQIEKIKNILTVCLKFSVLRHKLYFNRAANLKSKSLLCRTSHRNIKGTFRSFFNFLSKQRPTKTRLTLNYLKFRFQLKLKTGRTLRIFLKKFAFRRHQFFRISPRKEIAMWDGSRVQNNLYWIVSV